MLLASCSLIWAALSLMYISSTLYIQLLFRDTTDYVVKHLTFFDQGKNQFVMECSCSLCDAA